MKNIVITLLFILHFTSVFSQDFITIDVEMPEEFQIGSYGPFAYYALALDDGDFIFTQSIYDFDKQKDCGVRFIKMSPQGNITKSIFYEFKIEGSADYPHNCLIKNPYNENELIYTYFSYGEPFYYNAVFFDKDLNIIEEISEPFLVDDFKLVHISFLNLDNNFIYIWNAESKCQIAEVDIYGKVIKSSVLKENNNPHYLYRYSFFVYDKEKKQYGFIDDSNGKEHIFNIFDKDLNFIKSYTLSGYDGYKLFGAAYGYGCVASLNDGTFAFTERFYNPNDYNDRFLQMCRLDKNFNIIDKNIIGYEDEDGLKYSINKEWNDIVKCKDGSLYCIWYKNYNATATDLYVGYYDKDLNLLWERCCKKDMACAGNFLGIDVLEDGGLVLAGNNTGDWGVAGSYSSVIIFENNGTVLTEHNGIDFRPYSFYPNPASNAINISFSPDVNAEKVEIYGIDGKLYHEQNFNMESINVNGLSSSIYMMKLLMDNGETFSEKIVIK